MQNNRMKFILKILLPIILVIGLAGLRQFLQEKEDAAAEEDGVPYAEMVKDDHPLLKEFCKRYPEHTVLLACAEDITNDGIQDLVVISQLKNEITTIAIYTDAAGNLAETPSIPAPRENQHIRFFNMDKLSEIETLITGEKNGQVGYAIYRIMDGEMINLFGEGMEDCC